MKKCECKDWKENIEKVNAPWSLQISAVGDYKGKEFTHCPWCGSKLIEINYGNQCSPVCTCGTDQFKGSTAGCPVHGIHEFGIYDTQKVIGGHLR